MDEVCSRVVKALSSYVQWNVCYSQSWFRHNTADQSMSSHRLEPVKQEMRACAPVLAHFAFTCYLWLEPHFAVPAALGLSWGG